MKLRDWPEKQKKKSQRIRTTCAITTIPARFLDHVWLGHAKQNEQTEEEREGEQMMACFSHTLGPVCITCTCTSNPMYYADMDMGQQSTGSACDGQRPIPEADLLIP